MKLVIHPFDLPLQHPFTIARGTITHQPSVVVELVCNGVSGFGEVTSNDYYGQTVETISMALRSYETLLGNYANRLDDSEWVESLWDDAFAIQPVNRFALSALDMAANDLAGKLAGVKTYVRWGLKWSQVPASSYTIGIASVDEMCAKLAEQPDWPIYKIKLGTDHDLQIIESLRRHTDATFRVDANGGWTVDQAIGMSAALANLNVEFIEQPLDASASDADKQRLFAETALPLIADEDCQIESDVADCVGKFHGINVKLCKCGGLTPAVRMLKQAKQLGLKTMVGCMIESSIGISATAQLLPLLDYADLDGAVLLSTDPADGVAVQGGVVQLAERSGNGGRLRL